jgi:hypothetical protein
VRKWCCTKPGTGVTKKSVSDPNLLCGSYRRVSVILSILCHANWNRVKMNFGAAGDAKSLASCPPILSP